MIARKLSIVAALALLASPAAADTGVSDERVSLPDGPGSIGGIGENAQVEGNFGSMTLSVPMRVPAGFPGVTPEVALSYGSESGASVVGIGWSLAMPSIERMTSRALPEYTTDDRFVADGGSQLIKVSETMTAAVYRSRFERSFIRYTWHTPADGKAGYWTAEQPDGRVTYYGADRSGNLVETARITNASGGVFRYLAVETVDPFGNRVHYGYVAQDGYPLLDSIDYAHDADGVARFSVRLAYEARPDVISDAKPGFDLRLTRRLSEVRVLSGAEQIRSYTLEYESEEDSGGMSRLYRVTERGRGGEMYPVRQSFAYSRALGGACESNCEKPFVVDMGTLSGGVDLQTGAATLIDINGDSLPDVLDTTGGEHRFYISKASADGRPTFDGAPVASDSTTSAFVLGSPSVQVVDVDGNGFTDMISTRTGDVLCNDGSGDWNGSACLDDASLDIELEDDPDENGESDPLHVRFFDFDNDKRMDLLRTTSEGAADVRRATSTGFEALTIDAIGAAFDEGSLQLADVNGDGLQDPIELLTGGQLRYRLNLGRGKWADWVTLNVPDLTDAYVPIAKIEDINGDGLDDIAVVTADTLRYWLNRNGAAFDAPVAITTDNVDGELPETTSSTTVLFADMNGNGSSDVVWVTSSGHVEFLDLFPVKPNLLARIENGIGMVQQITYGTSLAELARDGAWDHHLNYAVNIVKSVDTWVTLTGGEDGEGLHELTTYAYHHGFYDGKEKQFRGFATVERTLAADNDDSQEPGVAVSRFDVGASDPYYAGLLLRADTYSGTGDARVPLSSRRSEYEDCAVAGVPADLLDVVRYVCSTSELTINQEGADEADWATTQKTREYDGYGNVVRDSSLGLVHMGSPEESSACRACADDDDVACGEDCLGDETYIETEYVVPGDDTEGAWLLRLPSREVVYGAEDGPQSETLFYYDGDDFEGLAAGKATQGKKSRVMSRVSADDGDLVALERHAFDAHGNIVGTLDPLGSADDASGHRREYTYDAYGLKPTRIEILLSDADGDYSLRREVGYEASFNEVSDATEWMLMRGGDAQSSRDSSSYRYDAHGRVVKIIRPGDSESAPTQDIAYTLASPVSTISIVRQAGEGADGLELRCIDGRGRTVQTVRRIADGRFLADGLALLNSRGAVVRKYDRFELSDAECSMSPPDGVAFTSYRYDPLFRPLETILGDAELYDGEASVERIAYGPLFEQKYDSEDGEGGAYEGTPLTRRFDGAGRLIAIERLLKSDDEPEITRLRYDSLDRMTGYIDAAGNVRTQSYDLLGRVTSVDDPNSGKTSFERDAAGNVVRKEDATGAVARYAYDGTNRIARQWDDSDEERSLVTYTYDAAEDCDDCTATAGRLAEVHYPVVLGDERSAGADRFGYDARRRRTYEARELEGVNFETEHEYDGMDRLIHTTFPDGQSLTRSYDGTSRLVAIDGVLDDVTYDERGLPAREDFANGVRATFEHDVRDRLSRQALADGEGDALFDVSFTRDRVGNILSAADAVEASEGRIARGFNSRYDAHYRATEATLTLDAAAEAQLAWTFDAIDNVIDGTPGAYEYGDQPNAATQAGPLALDYDAGGTLVKRGDLALSWDYQNRLVSAQRGDDVVGEFAYGATEERVIKLEDGHVVYYLGPELQVRDGISTVYPRLGAARLARLESDALATRVLSDVNDDDAISALDAWLVQSGEEDGSDVARLLAASAQRMLFEAEEPVVFLHEDHQQNVVAATNADGELIAERSFYPTGLPQESTGFVDDYGYSGQERDASTGLVHYRFRYFEPTIGRWASVDPAFEIVTTDSMSKLGEATTAYAFVANRYGNAIDPTGLGLFTKIGNKIAPYSGRQHYKQSGGTGGKNAKRAGKILVAGIAVGLAAVTAAVVAFVKAPELFNGGGNDHAQTAGGAFNLSSDSNASATPESTVVDTSPNQVSFDPSTNSFTGDSTGLSTAGTNGFNTVNIDSPSLGQNVQVTVSTSVVTLSVAEPTPTVSLPTTNIVVTSP